MSEPKTIRVKDGGFVSLVHDRRAKDSDRYRFANFSEALADDSVAGAL